MNSATPTPPPADETFSALVEQGYALLELAEVAGAERFADRALALARTPAELCEAKHLAARCRYIAGELDNAIVLVADACTAAAAAGDPVLLARAHTLEARCLLAAGEPQAALDQVLTALEELARAQRTDERAHTVEQSAVTALGIIYLQLGDLRLAMEWCQRAVELARQLQNQSAYGAALDTVACVHAAFAAEARSKGQHDEAQRCERMAIQASEEAVQVARRVGHLEHETSALLNLAESLTLAGEAPRAMTLLEDWEREHPDALPRQRSHHLESLGIVYLETDRAEDAVAAFQRASALNQSEPNRLGMLQHLSLALERCGRWQEALEQYKRFHQAQVRVTAERAQRSARLAAARLGIERERTRARQLATTNAELRRRAEDLRRQAHEDALTGLPNRRRVDEVLAAGSLQMSAAMIDVDHFKRINDRFSHAMGDQVLRQLGTLLRQSVRPSDLAARLGGEEFVVLFESGLAADPVRAAERIREAVEQHDWAALAPGMHITVSIGLARADEVTVGQDLLETADRRLYEAKRTGRNRVVHADA